MPLPSLSHPSLTATARLPVARVKKSSSSARAMRERRGDARYGIRARQSDISFRNNARDRASRRVFAIFPTRDGLVSDSLFI
jgi:hypothetical protein